MNKPHKHAEVIHAWADGAEIQFLDGNRWEDTTAPIWQNFTEYRVKPPREFPKSRLSQEDQIKAFYGLKEVHVTNMGTYQAIAEHMQRVADAAVKQYILDLEAGHVA